MVRSMPDQRLIFPPSPPGDDRCVSPSSPERQCGLHPGACAVNVGDGFVLKWGKIANNDENETVNQWKVILKSANICHACDL